MSQAKYDGSEVDPEVKKAAAPLYDIKIIKA